MSQKSKFIDIVRKTEQTHRRVTWEPDRIYDQFGRRGVPEIENSGEIHYLCCLERSYLVAARAFLEGIQTRLLTMKIKRPLQKTKLATAVEFDANGSTYTYVAAITGDKITDDIYPSRASHSHVARCSMEGVDVNRSWFENFGYHPSILVPGFDPRNYLDEIASKNSKVHLGKVLAAISKKRRLRPDLYL